ncbi:MAG TPA: ABC transporter ATP-binding protein [Gemmataceae bacterium]|nr:ABC transporter ATP-binding protein [Gemmataceae bacterium]
MTAPLQPAPAADLNGKTLALKPSEETSRPAVLDGRLWREVRACFTPYRWTALLIGLAILAGCLLGLAPPLLVRGLIDDAIPAGRASGSAQPLLFYIVALVLAPLIAALIGLGQDYLSTRVGQGILSDLRNRLFRNLQAQSLRFFTNTRSGEITSRVSNDVAQIRWAVEDTLPEILSNLATVIGTLVVLFWMSWPLALAACATVPVFLLPARRVGRWRRKLSEQTQEQHAQMLALLSDVMNVGGYILMRLFNRGDEEAARFAARNAELLRLRLKLVMAGQWMTMFVTLFGAVGPAVVYWYGGVLVIQGKLSIGAVVAFVAYLSGLYRPVTRLAGVYTSIQEAMGVFQRIVAWLDLTPEVRDQPGAKDLGPVRGEIQFNDVVFGYRKENRPALDRVSFTVQPGQLAALVGPSGAGKTTVTYLVPRFYDPQSGAVRIDGAELRVVTQASVAAQVGMVTQDTYLFHDTVRANLEYARPGATQSELESACRAAHIHDFIAQLPDGYETVVGERGVKLSGGERQRLAIARAILKDPRILILDEATSALDSTSERLIQDALAPLMKGRTTLAIAHRLSTILAADVILVLNEGRLVESGTHTELVRRGGLYARLYHEQFERAPVTG